MKRGIVMAFVVALLPVALCAEEAKELSQDTKLLEELSREMTHGKTIELKALEIRAKIFEPQVIYVLDRARVDVDFKEEDIHFTPRVSDPIIANEF